MPHIAAAMALLMLISVFETPTRRQLMSAAEPATANAVLRMIFLGSVVYWLEYRARDAHAVGAPVLPNRDRARHSGTMLHVAGSVLVTAGNKKTHGYISPRLRRA
jgi:hypothetical protein